MKHSHFFLNSKIILMILLAISYHHVLNFRFKEIKFVIYLLYHFYLFINYLELFQIQQLL